MTKFNPQTSTAKRALALYQTFAPVNFQKSSLNDKFFSSFEQSTLGCLLAKLVWSSK
jgi:hypothetical protein